MNLHRFLFILICIKCILHESIFNNIKKSKGRLARVYGRLLSKLSIDNWFSRHNSYQHAAAAKRVKMDNARVARALNRLGEDAFLFADDSEDLLELVDEYFDDIAPTSKIWPSLL